MSKSDDIIIGRVFNPAQDVTDEWNANGWLLNGHPYENRLEETGWVLPARSFEKGCVNVWGFAREDTNIKIDAVIRGDEVTETIYEVDKTRYVTVKQGRRKVSEHPKTIISERVVKWRDVVERQ